MQEIPEEIDIYDKSRNKTGKTKFRHKDTLESGEYTIGVQAVIINSQNKILISQRSKFKNKEPLKWECNGGALLSKENPVDGIIREIKEELGVKLEEKDAILVKTTFNGRRFKDTFLFFKDIDIKDIKFCDEETINAKWVTIEEFIEMFNKEEIVSSIDIDKEDLKQCLNYRNL